ncbi:MAG: hypothetical protein ACRDS1_07680, partial [Pseudonocardiaceae bacterium]
GCDSPFLVLTGGDTRYVALGHSMIETSDLPPGRAPMLPTLPTPWFDGHDEFEVNVSAVRAAAADLDGDPWRG